MTSIDTRPALAADEITPRLARLVLGHNASNDPDGLAYPSHGETLTLDWLCTVDDDLIDRFALGFPGLVAAWRLLYRQRGGRAELTAIARQDGQP